VIASKDAALTAKLHEKYVAEAERYHNDQAEAEAKAKELQKETNQERGRADRYDLGEVFLEIGLVVTSITLLSGRKVFWHAGIGFAFLGVVVAVLGVLMH
jgi:hypothetical protein